MLDGVEDDSKCRRGSWGLDCGMTHAPFNRLGVSVTYSGRRDVMMQF